VSHIVDAHVAYIKAIADLSRDKVELLERIKRLEEAGDRMRLYCADPDDCFAWDRAKETKP
jgi:hypothetical protein